MANQPDRKTPTHLLLQAIGGQAAIALECEVSESAVSQWATEDRLPKPREQYLRLAHPGEHWDEYDATRPTHETRADSIAEHAASAGSASAAASTK